jgi:hypothetical protein
MNHSSSNEWIEPPSPGDTFPRGALLARDSLLFTDGPTPCSTTLEAVGSSVAPASRWLLELLDEEDDRVCVLIADGGDE